MRNWSPFWSLLFALAALFSVGVFAYAPFSPDWWVPNDPARPYHVVSTFGREIDNLFLIILWITGIVFIGTQVVLVLEAWKFVDRPGRVATYFHGSQRLEVIWTIIPAAIAGLLLVVGVLVTLIPGDVEGKLMPPVRGEHMRSFVEWASRVPETAGEGFLRSRGCC